MPGGLAGTLGAVIRIREPIRTKRALFDMAVAGPIAGFVVLVPVMVIGLMLSRVAKLPPNFVGIELGEPLLFQAVTRLIFGAIPDGWSVNLHPMAMAAWFGMLATAINLFPIAQLDGGHISYAALGRRSDYVSLGALVTAGLLIFVSWSWLVWTLLLLVMLRVFGWRHPPTFDDHVPLSPRPAHRGAHRGADLHRLLHARADPALPAHRAALIRAPCTDRRPR